MRTFNPRHHIIRGYRSGLEGKVASQIRDVTGQEPMFESFRIEYERPARKTKYTPDYVLPNGIIIETKGLFHAEDREKHLLVREQHPDLDIRFVFTKSRTRIYPGSKTTVAMWCEKHGFLYAEQLIPLEWFRE